MKIKKSALFYTAFLTFLTIGVTFPNANVEASAVGYDCEPDGARIETLKKTGIKAYVESINVPYQKYIPKANATLTVNSTYLTDRCLIVYGGPGDVKKDGKKTQATGSNGEPRFLGYDQNGNPFSNPEYPDYKAGRDYIKIRPFYKEPWANSELQTHLKNSPKQPNTVNPNSSNAPKPTYTTSKTKELDRAVDRMYLAYCGSSCSLGKRGNFTQKNSELGLALTGANLVNYASVNGYPDKYVAGTFDLYYKSKTTGKIWYTTWYLPPYKQVLEEKRDLSVEIKSAPTSVTENQSYTVKYKVCNNGETIVKNPVIHYGEGSYAKSSKISTTLKPGGCYEGSLSNTASSVSANTDKQFMIQVNKSGDNPYNENNLNNNTTSKAINIKNNVINGSVKIVSHSPTNPHSNQQTTVKVEVCNESLSTVNNIVVKYGFKGSTAESKTIASLAAGACTSFSPSHKAPVVEKYSGSVAYEATLTKFSGDSKSSDNKASRNVTVKNPDAKVEVISSTDSSTSGVSDIKVKYSNNMLSAITNSCGNATGTIPCRTDVTAAPGLARINVYDTNFTEDTSDDILVHGVKPTFSLAAGTTTVVTISKSVILEYVQENYDSKYQLVQFRVATEVPHFAGEVDFNGEQSYTNNRDEDYFVFYPKRPIMAATKCNVLQHSYVSYFTTNGSNPIKICMGHFPTYPSTKVESGMQAYHFVLYRFFPTPLPKYTVNTLVKDANDPNHFSQLFTLPSSEAANQMGDPESMFFPNRTVNGYYQERGRYMPTGATYTFKVFKKEQTNQGTLKEGQTIALGSISYNIPSGCYDNYYLDIRHQYGCDEILFFLPNYDTDSKKYEKPENYKSDDVIYPIENTKIPYLNPGNYRFEFKADESFRYYYQTNTSTSGYQWSAPKFK